MGAKEVLEKLSRNEITVDEAEQYFRSEPFKEMGFAKLDTHRELRSGFPEVIFCQGKPEDYLVSIYEKMVEHDGRAFGTRASAEQYELVKARIPDITYDPVSKILKVERTPRERIGRVAVCCAGTADVPVAEEAAQTAEYFGTNVERLFGCQRNPSSVIQGGHPAESQLRGCHSGHGRGTCQCDRRTRFQSGHCGPDFGRLRSFLRRAFRTAYDDQFLCQRYSGGKYR